MESEGEQTGNGNRSGSGALSRGVIGPLSGRVCRGPNMAVTNLPSKASTTRFRHERCRRFALVLGHQFCLFVSPLFLCCGRS